MPDFPFEAVHEHFARKLDGLKLDQGDMPRIVALVQTDGTKVQGLDILPISQTELFFRSKENKQNLGQFIREVVASFGDSMGCVVVICEAYIKQFKVRSDDEIKKIRDESSLANDPEASLVVMIQIYTASEMRVAQLPIDNDRVVSYAGLMPALTAQGRMSLRPDEEDLPNGAKYH